MIGCHALSLVCVMMSQDWCSAWFFMMLNLRFVFNLIPDQSFFFGLNLLMQLNDCFSNNCDPWSSILMLIVLFDCCQKTVKSPLNLFNWASCDEPNSEFFFVRRLLELQTLRREGVLDELNAEFSFYDFWVAAILFVLCFWTSPDYGPSAWVSYCLRVMVSDCSCQYVPCFSAQNNC